jgi:hypothetical protein
VARPGEAERAEATRRLLDGLRAGDDAPEIARALWDLHPKNNAFPGELFIHLGAISLDLAAASSEQPVEYEGLLSKFLPECQFRGRENSKVKFAVLTSAARRGGPEADLLDEVVWWGTDDFWQYALYAAVALARASANRQGVTVAEHAEALAKRAGAKPQYGADSPG